MSRPVAVTPQIAFGNSRKPSSIANSTLRAIGGVAPKPPPCSSHTLSRSPVEQPFVRVAQQPVQRAGLDDLVLERRAFLVDGLDRLLEQRRRVHVRRLLGIAALGIVEVGRAGGDAEQILLRLEVQQAEPLGVGGPDELPRRRIAAHADAVGRLDQDR